MRFVLNKAERAGVDNRPSAEAEQLDRFELLRVFGGLMWSLSKVITTPEPWQSHVCPSMDKVLHGHEMM